MKRFVVLNSLGDIEIVTTDGHEPPNTLVEAHNDWTIHDISYQNGIVFRDPEKVRIRFEAEERERLRGKWAEEQSAKKIKIKNILDSRRAWFVYGILWTVLWLTLFRLFS